MKRDNSLVWVRADPRSLDLRGTEAAIIGGTGGLGRALGRFLASRGASVLVVGRTFRDGDVPGIEYRPADLSLMREARRVGASLPAESLDLIVLTTGIFAARQRQETAEGLERDLAVSYLSRLVIVREIGPRLGRNRPAKGIKTRVFVMGFPGAGQAGTLDDLNAERAYSPMAAHMNTVAGNEALVLDAAPRYPNASFFGLNPGLHRTDIRSNYWGGNTFRARFAEWMIGHTTPSPEAYAERLAPLLVSPDLEGHSGAMFDHKGRAIQPTPELANRSYASTFIAASEALVNRPRAQEAPITPDSRE